MARLLLVLVEAGSGAMAGTPATTALLAAASGALGATAVVTLARNGLVGQAPAAIASGLKSFGLSHALANGVVVALSQGSGAAVSRALQQQFGVTLSRDVPGRAAGSVLQKPTIEAVASALTR